jgi:hypothetical protein
VSTAKRSIVASDPSVVIDWSDTAATLLPNGHFVSAFCSNTYLAKVTRDNGDVVIVVLPPGSAQRQPQEYAEAVAKIAKLAGSGAGVVPVSPELLEDLIT